MTATGKGEQANLSTGTNQPGDPSSPNEATTAGRDLIPVPLLIGIFAVVMALTVFLLHENWITEMTRYRSIKYQQQGQWDKAAEQLNKLIEAGAEADNRQVQFSPTFLSELGYVHFRMGEYNEALKYFEQAQQYRANLPPDDQGNPRPPADFQNMLGITHFKLGNMDAAEKYLQGALQVNKLDPKANFTMGELLMKRGDYVQAANYFKTVANDPAYEEQVKKYYAEIERKLFAGIN